MEFAQLTVRMLANEKVGGVLIFGRASPGVGPEAVKLRIPDSERLWGLLEAAEVLDAPDDRLLCDYDRKPAHAPDVDRGSKYLTLAPREGLGVASLSGVGADGP